MVVDFCLKLLTALNLLWGISSHVVSFQSGVIRPMIGGSKEKEHCGGEQYLGKVAG